MMQDSKYYTPKHHIKKIHAPSCPPFRPMVPLSCATKSSGKSPSSLACCTSLRTNHAPCRKENMEQPWLHTGEKKKKFHIFLSISRMEHTSKLGDSYNASGNSPIDPRARWGGQSQMQLEKRLWEAYHCFTTQSSKGSAMAFSHARSEEIMSNQKQFSACWWSHKKNDNGRQVRQLSHWVSPLKARGGWGTVS